MFCPNCRRIENEPDRTTCGVCGAKLRAGTPEQPEGPDTEFLFTKDKGFSYFYYKEIKTEVSLTDTAVNITQTNTWFAFFKRPLPRLRFLMKNFKGWRSIAAGTSGICFSPC